MVTGMTSYPPISAGVLFMMSQCSRPDRHPPRLQRRLNDDILPINDFMDLFKQLICGT